jgi:hypothetical protein
MSTRGQSRPEPISQQTSTRSKRTKQPLTEHREPEIFETDTDTETKQETEPEEPEFEETKLDQLADKLAKELEKLQMVESKGKESKGKNTQEQAVTAPVAETTNPNARLIGDPGIFSGIQVKLK